MVALLLVATAVAPMTKSIAQDAPRAEGVKNMGLVYGALADGSSWAKVIPLLQAKAFNVDVTPERCAGAHLGLTKRS